MRTKQMSVFWCLLAASFILDYRGYSFSHTRGTPEGLAILCGALFFGGVLFNASSLPATLAAAAIGLVVLALDPQLSNHETLYVGVLVAIVATWLVAALRERTRRVDVRRYDETLAVLLRLVFFVFYYWTALQKWNDQFLDPAVSCAAYQLEKIATALPAIPIPAALVAVAGHVTIGVELLLPTLLLVRRTRRLGIALGLGFHTLLGIGFPAFQLLVFGFLLLFVPEPVFGDAFGRVGRAARAVPAMRPFVALLGRGWVRVLSGLAIAAASGELFHAVRRPGSRTLFGQEIYAALSLSMLGVLAILCALLVLRSAAWRTARPVPLVRPLPAVLWLLPFAVFLQGLQPHLGIKNIQAFAMFSNLDTDAGQSNHWVIPASLQISTNLADPVIIHDASHPQILQLASQQANLRSVLRAAKPPRLLPAFLALRREVTRLARGGSEGLMVDYTRAGVRRRVEHAERDATLAGATFVERFYLETRPLAVNRHGACRW